MEPRRLLPILWGFCNAQSGGTNFFDAIEVRVENGTTLLIPNTVWAFAMLNAAAPQLFAAKPRRLFQTYCGLLQSSKQLMAQLNFDLIR